MARVVHLLRRGSGGLGRVVHDRFCASAMSREFTTGIPHQQKEQEVEAPPTPMTALYRADWDYRGQRQKVPLGLVMPDVAVDAWVAPNATLVGRVEVCAQATVWYGCVLRGDLNKIVVGFSSHVFDRCVLHVASESPIGLPPHLIVGQYVTIGPYCTLRSCIIENECLIGERCVLMEGSIVERFAILEPGTVVPPGRRVPTQEVWAGNPAKFVRMATPDEIFDFKRYAEDLRNFAVNYTDEFQPYTTAYLQLEKLRKKLVLN